MSLFPHIWAIPVVFVVGVAFGWYLRARSDTNRASGHAPPIRDDD